MHFFYRSRDRPRTFFIFIHTRMYENPQLYADASAVRMWMTKARRFLMVQPEIMDACKEVTE